MKWLPPAGATQGTTDGRCSFAECAKPSVARGYCSTHYRRWQRHGDVNVLRRAPNGTGTMVGTGYRMFSRAKGMREYEHINVAEKALGRTLPAGAQVHHVNEIKSDNRGSNLVVCPNQAYHTLLHLRTRAYDACGHAGWFKCAYCGQYDDPRNLYLRPNANQGWHRKCQNEGKRRAA